MIASKPRALPGNANCSTWVTCRRSPAGSVHTLFSAPMNPNMSRMSTRDSSRTCRWKSTRYIAAMTAPSSARRSPRTGAGSVCMSEGVLEESSGLASDELSEMETSTTPMKLRVVGFRMS